MAWKPSCKDVATRVGRFAPHIIFFAWAIGGIVIAASLPSLSPQMTPLIEMSAFAAGIQEDKCFQQVHTNKSSCIIRVLAPIINQFLIGN